MSQYKLIVDSKPELKYIPMSKLYIPVKYQRALAGKASLQNVEHIKNNFNWAACGALLVCKLRKDAEKYAVIDGQHRFKGAELREDITELPCVVISPRDLKEQAEIFIDVNTKRQTLSPVQHYRALLVAGDTNALLLAKICEETDVVIPTYTTFIHDVKAEVFQSVGRLLQAMRSGMYTEINIRWAFEVIRSTYTMENGAFRYSMVRALLETSKKNPTMKAADIVKILMGTSVREIDRKARDLSGTRHGESLWQNYIEVIERYMTAKKKVA